jgi:hypothetical protein
MAKVAWPSTEVPTARQRSLEVHTMEPSPEIEGGVSEAAVATGGPWWIVLAGGDTFVLVPQPATSSVIAVKIIAMFDLNGPEPAGVPNPTRGVIACWATLSDVRGSDWVNPSASSLASTPASHSAGPIINHLVPPGE